MKGLAVACLIGLTMLTGCQPQDAPAQDTAQEWPQTRTACVAAGGWFEKAGRLQERQCILPTPDAGKTCGGPEDCVSVCMAQTRTCAPQRPMFGCFEILDAGQTAMLCVD